MQFSLIVNSLICISFFNKSILNCCGKCIFFNNEHSLEFFFIISAFFHSTKTLILRYHTLLKQQIHEDMFILHIDKLIMLIIHHAITITVRELGYWETSGFSVRCYFFQRSLKQCWMVGICGYPGK